MEEPQFSIRGLINDLTRTLTGSLVHMDNLLLHLDNDFGGFDDAWLANHQLERALEFFIELRSEYMIRQESINQKKTKSYKLTAVEKLLHDFNNLLSIIVGYCDIIQNDFADVKQICKNTGYIYQSIQNSPYLLNEPISLSERNSFINRLTISDRKKKQVITLQDKKCKRINRIMLVEDDQGVNKLITTVLRKHKYTVVRCSKGETALDLFYRTKASYDLCIVDIGLPDIEGPALVNKLLLKEPKTSIIFTSGYNEAKLKEHYDLIGLYPILIKPFRVEELLNNIRSIRL